MSENEIISILKFKEYKMTLTEFRKIIKEIQIIDMYFNISDEFVIIIKLSKLGRIFEIRIIDIEKR